MAPQCTYNLYTDIQYNKYRIVGKFGGKKFGKFGESSMICQTKTIQILTYNYYLWLNLSIRQTFPRQMLITVNSPNFLATKLSLYTVFYKKNNYMTCMHTYVYHTVAAIRLHVIYL